MGRLVRVATIAIAILFVASALGSLVPTAQGGAARYPIVLIPGWHGNADGFREMIPKLTAQGFTVLDFDTATAGIQAMGYAPTAGGQHISYVAGKIVQPKIQAALAAAGYPSNQKVDIVAHSMGGLVARFLIEKPGADVDSWSSTTGWYGDGVADVASDWASRVDDLVMLGTPSHGTWEAWVPTNIGGFGNWNPTGSDMLPGSKFLSLMGYAKPGLASGVTYHGIGGDPTYLQVFRYDYNGDGIAHGFDGVVPAESPFVTGEATFDLVNHHHGELLTADAPLDLIITHLGLASSQTGIGKGNLAGDAVMRLEYLNVVNDHDAGTADDYRLDVSVDPDGSLGPSGYQSAGSIYYTRDGPFTQNWGNAGPNANAIKLPGSSPLMDVKVVLNEEDPFSTTIVSTFYLTNILLSEDIDGMDYYASTAPDSSGGTNTLRMSMNGATSDVASTRLVTLGFDKAYIKDDHDCCFGNGEVQFTLNGGRDGFTSVYYRGDPGTNTHYSRADPAWVDIGTDAKNNGVVESEIIWSGRMLSNATLRFDVTYWEDDGGWSARDGGNMYYLQTALTGIAEGRTNYQGTTLPDYNTYLYVTKAGAGSGGSGTLAEPTFQLDATLDPLSLVPNGPDDMNGLPWSPVPPIP